MAHMLAKAARRVGISRHPYQRFIVRMEPELVARPRVHRFAAPPIVGAARAASRPLAVCVDPRGDGDAGITRASLERQGCPPAEVLEAPLARALGDTRADWVVRLEAGDQLALQALERLGQAVELAGDVSVLTADDDLIGPDGRRRSPRLRPGPSPDLWRAIDPGFRLVALRRDAAVDVIGDGDGSNDGLVRQLGGPDGAGHAHVPFILCHAGRRRPAKTAEPLRRLLAAEPSVEAIVPFRDRPELLERCARSLLERSTYERLSLRLVDNRSRDPRTAELLGRLSRDDRVTVDSDPGEFNFSALNNAAARRSRAGVLLFLNSDTEVVEDGWIEVLLGEALRSEVGAVAPLLVYPDGRVQHAGAALGLHGWAGHPFAGLAPDEETAFGAASDGPRNWLAVTAACLMVERRKFLEVDGFDEDFRVGGGDIDLGLRLTRAGYRSLSVPAVRLVHDESATRDPAAIPPSDFEASRRSYGEFRTVGDPFYHPALTLRDTSCRVRTDLDEAVPS